MPRKLNDMQVKQIEELLKKKKPAEIARNLGVTPRIIQEIRDGVYVNKVKPKQQPKK